MLPKKRPPSEDNDVDHSLAAKPKKKRMPRQCLPSSIRTRSARFLPMIAVFLTTELLEKILLELPMKDLLLAQRVCKKWRSVIDANKDIQRALFFLPEEPSIHWKAVRCQDTICGCVKRVERAEYDSVNNISSRGYSVRLNPLLRISEVVRMERNVIHWGKKSALGAILSMDTPPNVKEASWRRMHVTQPPMQHRYRAIAKGHSRLGQRVRYRTNMIFNLSAAPTAGRLIDGVKDMARAHSDLFDASPITVVEMQLAGAVVSSEEEEEVGAICLNE